MCDGECEFTMVIIIIISVGIVLPFCVFFVPLFFLCFCFFNSCFLSHSFIFYLFIFIYLFSFLFFVHSFFFVCSFYLFFLSLSIPFIILEEFNTLHQKKSKKRIILIIPPNNRCIIYAFMKFKALQHHGICR